jgi:hypothetical protein
MSKTSGKQRYQQFQEWHAWAKTQYPSFRAKKKKTQTPKFTEY